MDSDVCIWRGQAVFIWQVKQCALPLPAHSADAHEHLASAARQAGLAYVPVKVADGPYRYNQLAGGSGGLGWRDEILPGLLNAFTRAGLRRVGWHYLYGAEPEREADTAAERMVTLGLEGYILDAESEYKLAGADAARRFMRRLRKLAGNIPLALCSYRFPSYHREFPWQAFLDEMEAQRGDAHMPQVYWVGDARPDGPAVQLQRSLKELRALKELPVAPIGAAYGQQLESGYWRPSPDQMRAFSRAAQSAGCAGLSWWSWDSLRAKDGSAPGAEGKLGWWDAIAGLGAEWGKTAPEVPLSLEQRVVRLEARARAAGWPL